MRILLWIVTSALLITGLYSCSNSKPNTDRESARSLYERSLKLTHTYIDSMETAKDSATVNGLSERFDNLLTKLNYEYSAQAAISVSEGENDTLCTATAKFVSLRDSLLYRFAHPLDSVAPADSVTLKAKTDSLPQPHPAP